MLPTGAYRNRKICVTLAYGQVEEAFLGADNAVDAGMGGHDATAMDFRAECDAGR